MDFPATQSGSESSEPNTKHAAPMNVFPVRDIHPQVPPSQDLHYDTFEIIRPLGEGRFAQVYYAKNRQSNESYALKVMGKTQLSRDRHGIHIQNEIDVHSSLDHPGIIKFHTWFHDNQRVVLVLECALGGELYALLQQEECFSEQRTARYISQVTKALIYLHSRNIMYREVKPENIVITTSGELKLVDFGWSIFAPNNKQDALCGTLDYLPPEMAESPSSPYTNAVDIWSLGVLTYELLVGKIPWGNDDATTTLKKIKRRDMAPFPDTLSDGAREFVCSLMKVDASERLPLDQVLSHPWIVGNCSSES